jgi:phosphoserine phosphatase RsbU/P
MNAQELKDRIDRLRVGGLDPDEVEGFLRVLEASDLGGEGITAVVDEYDRLNDVLDGLANAVDEFQGLGAAASHERLQLLIAARTRFSIQLSALLADDDIPLDTVGGSLLSTSMHVFRDNLRAVAMRMSTLVQQTIKDSGMRKELELAGAVQGMLMSSANGTRFSDLRAYCWYEPAEQCAGDLFSVDTLGEGDVLMLMGDATGHGAPAALVAAVVKGACDLARLGMRGALKPYQLLRMLNRVLVESVRGEYLMTCVAARYRLADRMLCVANAGHRSVWIIRGGEIRVIPGSGDPPLGARSVFRYEEVEVPLEPGDRVIMFTDGIPECEDPNGAEFGERKLRDVVLQASQQGTAMITTGVREAIDAHMAGRRALDDLTFVCVELVEAHD